MSENRPGLVDALIEVGRKRQQILSNLRRAFEANDLAGVLVYVEQLIGLDGEVKGASEKGN